LGEKGSGKRGRTIQSQPTGKYSTQVARDRFLKAVANHFPKVLQALRLEVLPHFSSLFEIRQSPRTDIRAAGRAPTYGVAPNFRAGPPERYVMRRVPKEEIKRLTEDPLTLPWRHSWSRDFARAVDPKRIAVRDRLAKWGKIWRLHEEWIYDIALDTMMWWAARPSWPDMWHHDRHWGIASKDAPPALTICEEWWFEPWSQFESKIQSQIDTYKGTIDAYHARHGYDPESVGNSPHHYVWLALFQVGRKSPSSILVWHEKTHSKQLAESAITKGYTRLAGRIGLTLRTKSPS
jgi:hypothetical protein